MKVKSSRPQTEDDLKLNGIHRGELNLKSIGEIWIKVSSEVIAKSKLTRFTCIFGFVSASDRNRFKSFLFG